MGDMGGGLGYAKNEWRRLIVNWLRFGFLFVFYTMFCFIGVSLTFGTIWSILIMVCYLVVVLDAVRICSKYNDPKT